MSSSNIRDAVVCGCHGPGVNSVFSGYDSFRCTVRLSGAMVTHLVNFQAVTLGLGGPDLGSDERDVVLLHYSIFSVAERKVSFLHLFSYSAVTVVQLL